MDRMKIGLSMLIAAPALLAITPAAAQQPTPTPPPVQPQPTVDPNAIRGTLQVCDCARGEHRVRLEAGRRYAISATSPDFDPLLRLLLLGSKQVIAEDDDSGGGVTPRLLFAPTTTADYVVRVSSFARGAAGNYALSVTPLPPLPVLVARPTGTYRGQWQVFEGNLAQATGNEFGRAFTDYRLRLRAGEVAMIHVLGDGTDTTLQVFPAGARAGKPLAEDDDGGGGFNPFLYFVAPQAGTYAVRVIGADERARGAYRLRIAR